MMSNRHAMPARSANAPAGSTGIEILVLLGMRQLAVFAIALEGAGVLVKPVKDNRPGLAPPYALTQCATPVVPDAADDIADGVAMTDVDLRHDPLQGQRLALEPALHLGPGFGVVVVDASLGHVTDTATVAVQALRQFHVLQAGDLLIEPVLRPGAAGNRRIGVVAEEAFLRKAGLIGEVLGEDATFAVATFRPADLLAIAVVDKAVDDRLAQRPQPMPVTRNAMAAYQNQDLALSGLAAQVQRAARSEEHTSELQSLIRISIAAFCFLKERTLPRIYTYSHTLSRPDARPIWKTVLVGRVLGENATFAVATFRPADLLSIAVVDKAVDDRLAQRPQPMPVTRNAMAAYQNQDLALSGLAAQVQRAAEGELLPGDVGDHAAMLFGHGQIGRAHV